MTRRRMGIRGLVFYLHVHVYVCTSSHTCGVPESGELPAHIGAPPRVCKYGQSSVHAQECRAERVSAQSLPQVHIGDPQPGPTGRADRPVLRVS